MVRLQRRQKDFGNIIESPVHTGSGALKILITVTGMLDDRSLNTTYKHTSGVFEVHNFPLILERDLT